MSASDIEDGDRGRGVWFGGITRCQQVGHHRRAPAGCDSNGKRIGSDRHGGLRIPGCAIQNENLIQGEVGDQNARAITAHRHIGRLRAYVQAPEHRTRRDVHLSNGSHAVFGHHHLPGP